MQSIDPKEEEAVENKFSCLPDDCLRHILLHSSIKRQGVLVQVNKQLKTEAEAVFPTQKRSALLKKAHFFGIDLSKINGDQRDFYEKVERLIDRLDPNEKDVILKSVRDNDQGSLANIKLKKYEKMQANSVLKKAHSFALDLEEIDSYKKDFYKQVEVLINALDPEEKEVILKSVRDNDQGSLANIKLEKYEKMKVDLMLKKAHPKLSDFCSLILENIKKSLKIMSKDALQWLRIAGMYFLKRLVG